LRPVADCLAPETRLVEVPSEERRVLHDSAPALCRVIAGDGPVTDGLWHLRTLPRRLPSDGRLRLALLPARVSDLSGCVPLLPGSHCANTAMTSTGPDRMAG
jgi:hypothetical protein